MPEGSKDDSAWTGRPWRIAAWATATGLMLLPIAVRFVSGNFGSSAGDFIFVAAVLFTGCLIFDLATRRAHHFAYLGGAAAGLAAGLGMFVINGAVGLVGSEDEAHNLLFLAVILVAIMGGIVARGRPAGMARAMAAAAFMHIVVSTVLLIDAGGASDGEPRTEVVGISAFAAMWLASAWLFRRAANVPE